MAASDNPQQTSPKLIVGGLVGVAVTAATAAGAIITPDVFAGFGEWAPFWFVFVTTGFIGLGVWWKTDPLRLNTLVQAQAIAQEMVRNGNVLPEPEPVVDQRGRHEADPAVEEWPTTNKG
jgi:hypothetical protein